MPSNSSEQSRSPFEPFGWYVHDGRCVKGPFPFSELEQVARASSDPLHCSRSGMSGWVDYDALSEIYRRVENHKKTKEELILDLKATLELGFETLGHSQIKTAQPEKPQKVWLAPKLTTDFSRQRARAKLALGEPRRPFVVGLLLPAVSLGFSYLIWSKQVDSEVSWHMGSGRRISSLWFLPLFHFAGWAKLNKNIDEMCGPQSEVRKVPLWLTMLPPIFVYLVQRKLNWYWHKKLVCSQQ